MSNQFDEKTYKELDVGAKIQYFRKLTPLAMRNMRKDELVRVLLDFCSYYEKRYKVYHRFNKRKHAILKLVDKIREYLENE